MEKSTTDLNLIRRIAKTRDKYAFEELLKRYQRLLYSIAIRLTKRDHLAEDAIQAAMLCVWLSAARFREIGSVRNWMIAIVLSECAKVMRKGYIRKSEVELEKPDKIQDFRTAEVEPERNEMLGNLRTQFLHLSLPYRQVLTLYYGAELSQREIGKLLKIPQRTVSDRLNKGLGLLRSKLCQVGMAAAVPLITDSGMKEALNTGFEMSVGLQGRIVENVFEQAVGNPVDSSVTIKSHTGLITGVLATLAVIGALVSAAVLNSNESKIKKSSSMGSAKSSGNSGLVQEPLLTDAQKDMPTQRFWDFDRFPSGFENAFGDNEWSWAFGNDTKTGSLVTYPKRECFVLVPGSVPSSPFKIEFTGFSVTHNEFFLSVRWSDGQRTPAHRYQPNRIKPLKKSPWKLSKNKKRRVFTNTWYFFDQYAIWSHPNYICGLATYPTSYPGRRIVLCGKNAGIEDLKITLLKMDEIPKFVLNAKRLLQSNGSQVINTKASPAFFDDRKEIKPLDRARFYAIGNGEILKE